MKKFIVLAVTCCILSSCGIKPGRVEAPSGDKNDTFPREYPNTSTDPAP